MDWQINEFYAVTTSHSLYDVEDGLVNGRGYPIATKLILGAKESGLPQGYVLNGEPRQPLMVIYGPGTIRGLHFLPDPRYENSSGFGHSCPVIGLFLTANAAQACFEAVTKDGSEKCFDPRWQQETRAVLVAIGDDHPVFRVSKTHPFPEA